MNTHLTRMFGRRGPLTAKEAEDFGPAAYIEAVAQRDEIKLKRFHEVSAMTLAQHGVRVRDNIAFVALAPEALVGVAPKNDHRTQTRDWTADGAAGASYLIGTEQPAFVEALRSRSLISRLKITTIEMHGDAALPKLGASTTGWLAGEDAQHVEPNIAVTAVSATPKYNSARFTMSHQFHRQIGPGGRRAVDTEVALGVDAAFTTAIIAGTGNSGQPLGIVGTSGVSSASGTDLAWSSVATLQGGVDAYDTGDGAWVMGAGAAATLRGRTRESGSGRFIFDDNGICGKPTIVHSAVPTATAVVGCWSRLALAVWGPLEIMIDPFSDFRSGKVSVAVRQAMDVVVLQAAAFGKAESIT